MKKLKLPIIIDSCFIFFCSFVIVFAVIRYSGINFIFSLILSIFISLVLAIALLAYFIYKSDKSLIKSNEQDSVLNLKLSLCFMPSDLITTLFLKYYTLLGLTAKKEKGHIVVEENKTQVFTSFTFDKTDFDKIIFSYKQTKKGYTMVFLSCEYTTDALNLVKEYNLDIKLLNINDVYLALKSKGLLPEYKVVKPNKKQGVKELLKGVFVKSNGKKALRLGAIILLSSNFTFYPIYYIIFGSLMIIFSIVLRFWGKESILTTETQTNLT